MGRRVKKRGCDISGVIVLDKPIGLSSRQALNKVNDLIHAAKIGHTGSLDPMATGVLPLVLGNATKFSQFLLNADKEYEVSVKLGVATDSGDAEGNVIEEKPVEGITRERIDSALDSFRGEIWQMPPMFSALKHNGQPLYKLARRGEVVEREARKQTIFENRIVGVEGTTIDLHLHCSKGTYVRTIVHELGQSLGCGAHVSNLRRTRAGPFHLSDAYTLAQLETAKESHSIRDLIKPVASTISHWPPLILNKVAAFYLRQGQAIVVGHSLKAGWVGLFEGTPGDSAHQNFMGVGEILGDGRVAPRRLIA